jgi:hypothetical protein
VGIGLVAVFWVLAGVVGGGLLSGTVWVLSLRTPAELRKRRATFAFLLPFGCLAWACPAGLLWIGWGALTGFNAQFGIGDSWEVALPNGYRLLFIDVDDRASIHGPAADIAVVGGVTSVAAKGSFVYGQARRAGFVLDTTSGRLEVGEDSSFLQSRNLDAAVLVPVGQYPGRPRTSLDNIVLVGLLLIPPTVMAAWVWQRRLRYVDTSASSEAG